MKKQVRSVSGITPLAVTMRPEKCKHGACVYCPQQEGIPNSYTRTSPVVLRGLQTDWSAKKQIDGRLRILREMEHDPQKIELILMGGTFSDYPDEYRFEFVKECFDALNGSVSASLEEAKKINETARQRCVAFSVETRPDRIDENEINKLLEMGVTRVELGVQILDNKSYKETGRKHSVEDVVRATKLLKDAAFKITYHTMIGLPGSTPEKDIENFKKIFTDERFKPDHIKIYPTFVVRGTALEKMFNEGKFQPYSAKEIVNILIEMKKIVPRYVRIMRVMRDIPREHIVSECIYSHLRDEAEEKMKTFGVKCNCIRCHELGHTLRKNGIVDEDSISVKRLDYDASEGKEIFLTVEDKFGTLISLLRMRIPGDPFRKEILKGTALIREIHTYSRQVGIGDRPDKNEFQHRGYGKMLMIEAERIAKENGCNKIIIIAGVGVREYFYKLDYKTDGPYVSKLLSR